jgi:hypothetical protein
VQKNTQNHINHQKNVPAHLLKQNLTLARVINQEHEAKFSSGCEQEEKKEKGCAAQHQHFRFSETRRSRFSTPEYMGNTRARVYVLRPRFQSNYRQGLSS